MIDPDDKEEVSKFEDHQRIKKRVLKGEKRPFGVISLSGEVATATAKEGVEEIIEVLTSSEGKKFIRSMALEVVKAYLKCCATDEFRNASRTAAGDVGTAGTVSVVRAIKELHDNVVQKNPVTTRLLRDWTCAWIVAMSTALLLAAVRFIVFGTGPIRPVFAGILALAALLRYNSSHDS